MIYVIYMGLAALYFVSTIENSSHSLPYVVRSIQASEVVQ
jgi:hypothetical protein